MRSKQTPSDGGFSLQEYGFISYFQVLLIFPCQFLIGVGCLSYFHRFTTFMFSLSLLCTLLIQFTPLFFPTWMMTLLNSQILFLLMKKNLPMLDSLTLKHKLNQRRVIVVLTLPSIAGNHLRPWFQGCHDKTIVMRR